MKKGFTLAEVLITLSIIGVVAALTIPQLVNNMNDYAFGKSKDVTLAKITEATNQMKSNDVLDGYATTAAFADEFQKYLKVAKRCSSANLTDCFAPNFTSSGGKSITTSTLTTGDKLGQSTYTSPTVAFGLANGTTILFAFNPACARIDPTDNQSNTTACLSMLYDINGSSKPNKIGKDTGAVNVELDYINIGGLLVESSDTTYSAINTCSGGTAEDKAYDPTGDSNAGCAANAWAGANKACLLKGLRLPLSAWFGASELQTLYDNKAILAISNSPYWSGTNPLPGSALTQYFNDGTILNAGKAGNGTQKARCVK